MTISDIDCIINKAEEVELYDLYHLRDRKEIFDDQRVLSIHYVKGLLVVYVGERVKLTK